MRERSPLLAGGVTIACAGSLYWPHPLRSQPLTLPHPLSMFGFAGNPRTRPERSTRKSPETSRYSAFDLAWEVTIALRGRSLFGGSCHEVCAQSAVPCETSLRGRSLFKCPRGQEVPRQQGAPALAARLQTTRSRPARRVSHVAGPRTQVPCRRYSIGRDGRAQLEGPLCGPFGITSLPYRIRSPPRDLLQKTLAAWVRAPSARAKMGLAAAVCAILGGGAPPPCFCALFLTSRALYHRSACCNIFRERTQLLPLKQSFGDYAPGFDKVSTT